MKKNITNLVSVTLLGGLVGRGLRYGFNYVIARGLGAEALGTFAFGLVVMKAAGVLARAGLTSGAQKYVAIYSNDGSHSKLTGTVLFTLLVPLLWGSVLVVLFTVGSPFVKKYTAVSLDPTIEQLFFGVPLLAALMTGISATRGFKETRYAIYARDFTQSGVALLLIAVGAFIFKSLEFVVAGYLFSLLVGLVLVIAFLFHQGAFDAIRNPKIDARELLSFSLPLLLVAVTQYFMSWTDIFLLGILASDAAVGYYQVAFQTSMLLLVVLQSANSIFPALAAQLYHDQKMEKLGETYTVVTKWVSYFTLLGFLFIFAFKTDVLRLFGSEFVVAETALVVLGAGQLVAAVAGPSGYLLTMAEYERLELLNTIVVMILNVILNIILIRQYGIVGAAIATSFSLALINIIQLAEIWYLLGIHPYSKAYYKGVVAAFAVIPVLAWGVKLPLPNIVRLVVTGSLTLLLSLSMIWYLGLSQTDSLLLQSLEE